MWLFGVNKLDQALPSQQLQHFFNNSDNTSSFNNSDIMSSYITSYLVWYVCKQKYTIYHGSFVISKFIKKERLQFGSKLKPSLMRLH